MGITMTNPIFSLLLITGLAIVSVTSDGVSDQCLGCICQASTKCQKDIGCIGNVCGPLLISWPFWADAGKLVITGTSPTDSNAYPQCANDLYCAGETVRSYMAKYQKDCNGDGVINCEDYSRIHKFGPASCDSPSFSETDYGKQFQQCNAGVQPQ